MCLFVAKQLLLRLNEVLPTALTSVLEAGSHQVLRVSPKNCSLVAIPPPAPPACMLNVYDCPKYKAPAMAQHVAHVAVVG